MTASSVLVFTTKNKQFSADKFCTKGAILGQLRILAKKSKIQTGRYGSRQIKGVVYCLGKAICVEKGLQNGQ